ncbi:MAG TPA: PIN domain-containing protein [Planctomycetota bacterium]|nr:PIN domain-containing protein [Planctomycetota bacterium]
MNACFADSFYYLALLNRLDASHERAVALSESLDRPTVTTAWVLTEVADALSAPHQRRGVVRLVDTLRADPGCTILGASDDLFERGFTLYRGRADKDWSLTDCISFVVMRERGVVKLRQKLEDDPHNPAHILTVHGMGCKFVD